ncbi:MAG TPA: hypothetical protein VNZ53_47660 [Steroidobacteraceae bacterium]|nr:hypothetical protein [Steroidobacteraceae bacterium]
MARFANAARHAVFERKIGHAIFRNYLLTAMGSSVNGSGAQRLHEQRAAHRPRDPDLIAVAL